MEGKAGGSGAYREAQGRRKGGMVMRQLKVGDKLWFVSSRRNGLDREVVVMKVGRKWAYLSGRDRIDLESWGMDGGEYISPGRCYESKDAYESSKALWEEWSLFKRKVAKIEIPGTMTLERISELSKEFGI
jgi:hypothetical protein